MDILNPILLSPPFTFDWAEVIADGKLCIGRVTVSPALIGYVKATPALQADVSATPALLAKVEANQCQE